MGTYCRFSDETLGTIIYSLSGCLISAKSVGTDANSRVVLRVLCNRISRTFAMASNTGGMLRNSDGDMSFSHKQ